MQQPEGLTWKGVAQISNGGAGHHWPLPLATALPLRVHGQKEPAAGQKKAHLRPFDLHNTIGTVGTKQGQVGCSHTLLDQVARFGEVDRAWLCETYRWEEVIRWSKLNSLRAVILCCCQALPGCVRFSTQARSSLDWDWFRKVDKTKVWLNTGDSKVWPVGPNPTIRSYSIRLAKPFHLVAKSFCQWWKHIIFTKHLLIC